jgi:hypothetical protein
MQRKPYLRHIIFNAARRMRIASGRVLRTVMR